MGAYYIEAGQIITVKNNTDETLYNLKFFHNGEGSNECIIKKLKKNFTTKVSLFVLKAKGYCDLIMEYEYKGVRESMVIYDKIQREDRRYLMLELTDEDGELKANISFQDIYD